MCDRQKQRFPAQAGRLWRSARSVGSALIATYDAKHARDMDSSRLRYDDGPSERCRAADRKTQQGCRVAGLAPACADTRSHMRQEDRESCSLC